MWQLKRLLPSTGVRGENLDARVRESVSCVTRDLNPRPSLFEKDAQPTELVSLVDSFLLRIQWTEQDSNLQLLVSFYLEALLRAEWRSWLRFGSSKC